MAAEDYFDDRDRDDFPDEDPPARPQHPRRERTAIHPAYDLASETELAPPPTAGPEFKIHGSPYKLLTALSQARAEFGTVAADSTGQFQNRHFKYADLSTIYAAAIPALAKHGICVIHPNCQSRPGVQRAVTVLAGHDAMLEVAVEFNGSLNPDNVKGYGSMLTYINRYQTRGLVAVAGDDDPDNSGNSGTKRWGDEPERPRQQNRQAPRPQQRAPEKAPERTQERPVEQRRSEPPTRSPSTPPPTWTGPGMSPHTTALITARLEELGIDPKDGRKRCRELTGRSAGTLHEEGGEEAALAFLKSLG